MFLMNGSSKEQDLFGIVIFCNIINAFAVTSDQFNASLLNKCINSFKKMNCSVHIK